MSLPSFTAWENTRISLHHASQVTARFRKAQIAPQINSLHLGQFVTPDGITTGTLDNGSEIHLSFARQTVIVTSGMGQTPSIPLTGHSQNSLTEALGEITGVHPVVPNASDEPFIIDAAQAADYAHVLNIVYTGIARYRGRLLGTMTPIVLWEHGFDISFVWFRGNHPDEHHEPHINIGFSPGSPGFEQPYLYGYASPMPDNVTARTLPPEAYWTTERWKGAVLPYSAIAASADPVDFVERYARAIHSALL